MKTNVAKERSFSVELSSKANLKSVTMANGLSEEVLVEGIIGELMQVEFVEGIIIEVVGEKGVLRIDLTEDEVKKVLQGSRRAVNASGKIGIECKGR